MHALVSQIKEHERRRDFFLRVAGNPREAIKSLLLAQATDLATVRAAETAIGPRFSAVYRRPWVAAAVGKVEEHAGTR